MRIVCFCIFLILLSSCSAMQPLRLPELTEASFDPQLAERCTENVVQGNWQFVHSITFEMANGQGATVIGVTVLDKETIKTGLIGVEGFVLFEAELVKEKKLKVKRALPPFDNPEFAAGLMRDVETIFSLSAAGNPVTGQLAGGESVCRYQGENGQIVDMIIGLDESRKTHIYDVDRQRIKSIVMESFLYIDARMIPEKIHLTAHGLQGYTLRMTLIRAEKL